MITLNVMSITPSVYAFIIYSIAFVAEIPLSLHLDTKAVRISSSNLMLYGICGITLFPFQFGFALITRRMYH